MPVKDLREFIEKIESMGELKKIGGADWNLEIGALTEMVASKQETTALLFHDVKDYENGPRILTNCMNSMSRTAIALDLQVGLTGLDLLKAWRRKLRTLSPIKPIEVNSGPIYENTINGADIDLMKFPSPKWHKFDGGRYIGTACVVISRDPEEDWVNLGTYRMQVHDKDTTGIYMGPGKHGRLIAQKYWEKGENCPIAVSLGHEPAVYIPSNLDIPWGFDEYDYAGWIRGKPVEVVRGKVTGLPIPAYSEIVVEGEILPPSEESRPEGPFGEYTGYYTESEGDVPVIKVKAIHHRDNPIILGQPPLKPPALQSYCVPIRAADLWNRLEDLGHVGIRGVWQFLRAGGPMMDVVSVKQSYSGHAKQIGYAINSMRMGLLRFVILVDDDIDPSNINEVMWAVTTRTDPETSIEILKDCFSAPFDPRMPPEKKAVKDYRMSRAVIDACKPFNWRDDFPKVNAVDEDTKKMVLSKWKDLFP